MYTFRIYIYIIHFHFVANNNINYAVIRHGIEGHVTVEHGEDGDMAHTISEGDVYL